MQPEDGFSRGIHKAAAGGWRHCHSADVFLCCWISLQISLIIQTLQDERISREKSTEFWQLHILNGFLLVFHLALTHPTFWKRKDCGASGALPSLGAVSEACLDLNQQSPESNDSSQIDCAALSLVPSALKFILLTPCFEKAAENRANPVLFPLCHT